ncbi:YaiI/YqxD family protein [Tepidanaerobacter acetatoxydans]|uniref:YaiI/YqxD family protein n=1 Tax=Tepidanaerobacter acetatoxydans TaxID=499229 RepID=UPI001BD532BD|nr:YaiI/YqxD family protein [Tepidanaerobacter acetatoxydans]
MKILVDADGCPVVGIAIKIAKSYGLEIVVVKNFSHYLEDNYATIVTVDQSPDSADYYIANHTSKGDIVITQDYGLAAMVLAKEAFCINQNGLIISSENIQQLLTQRHINREIRTRHHKYTKFKKREPEQDAKFERNLRYLIKKLLAE